MLGNLLQQYKNLINFDDRDEKANFKWVSTYIAIEQKRKIYSDSELEKFMLDAIEIQKRYINRRNFIYGLNN